MHLKKIIILSLFLTPLLAWADKPSLNSVKLYAMDCGTIDVSDMKDFSSHGDYDGQKIRLVNPCFLIRHPQGDLIWDVGHKDSLADTPDGELSDVWHSKLSVKLMDQLAQLGLSVKDIEYVSLSHAHPDHAGNANQFSASTFLVNQLERKYMFAEPARGYFGANYLALEKATTISFSKEHDVFGDGAVVIKSMPGHTPGSSVLLVRLHKAGNVLLTGDLYIHERERKKGTMLKYNVDKPLTVVSRGKFEKLVKKERARVIIQHEKRDFESLPKFPQFLD